jgi:hypothetical protein
MVKEKPMRIYRCSEAELYAVCVLGWRNYLEHVTDFENHSTTYTTAYGQAALAEVEMAERMPDEQARNGVPETLRIKLKQKAKAALRLWDGLSRHVNRAWAEALVKPHVEAAGLGYYKRARNDGWDELLQLLVAGKKFIDGHQGDLLAGGMPVNFKNDYVAALDDVQTLYLEFKDAQLDMREQRNAKTEANNAIMKKVNAMFADGQLIYEFDAGKRRRFVFVRLLELVRKL